MSGDVLFVLLGEEICMPRNTVERGSAYLAALLEGSPGDTEVRIVMPDWVARRPLMIYLEYLTSKSVPKVDLWTAQKILWVADFLYDDVLQKALLYDIIQPNITCEVVVAFLQDAHTKLLKTPSNPHWRSLLDFCVKFVASHAETVFQNQQESLFKFPSGLLEEVIEASLDQLNRHQDSDYTYVIATLKHLRGVEDTLQLLALEEQMALAQPLSPEPVFSWTLTDVSLDNSLQETPPFEIAGLSWHMKAWSFAHEARLAVAIVPGSNPLARIPKQSFVSLLTQIRTGFSDQQPASLLTVVLGTKAQAVLRHLDGLGEAQLRRLTLQLCVRVCPTHAAVLTHITRCPVELSGKYLRSVPEKTLISILTHKRLNVSGEDEVLEAIGRWVGEVYGQEVGEDVELCKVLEAVRWDYVSLKGIFHCIRNFAGLRKSKCFREIMQRVVEQRASQNRFSVYDLTGKVHAAVEPRRAYRQTASKETFQSQKDFMEYVTSLVLEMEYSPKAAAVGSS